MFKKIEGIKRLISLGLPTPKTIFIKDIDNEINKLINFLSDKEFVMIRSESINQSTHCPSMIKATKHEALQFIKKLNDDGFIAIVQEHVPLNNLLSGTALRLNELFIIEAIRGGPGSKLTRNGLLDEHLRVNNNGEEVFHYGKRIITKNLVKLLMNYVSIKHHIFEFSVGPDWFYFWDAKPDPTTSTLFPRAQ